MRRLDTGIRVLVANTAAFTACFSVWMLYGALITFLVDRQVYQFSRTEMGWLIGAPVLTGSLLRLPAGMLADRFGGRLMFAAVMLLSAAAAYLVSLADGFWTLLAAGFGFGIAGASFAVGIPYTSAWFTADRQGTALGIFGAGTSGTAITSLVAPWMLGRLTGDGAHPEAWRLLPRGYAFALLAMTIVFWILTIGASHRAAGLRTLRERLAPLRSVRMWRFGLYYFLLFGGFVALSQWLIPYYLSVYSMTLVAAGAFAAAFSLPAGLARILGGWLSDQLGARRVMYLTLGGCAIAFALLSVPRMGILMTGEPVLAVQHGVVHQADAEGVFVSAYGYYPIRPRPAGPAAPEGMLVFRTLTTWHEPVVAEGDVVEKGQMLARGVTRIYFQANILVFTLLLFLGGLCMGIGMAAVYKHIPAYFPNDVGTVAGMVGVLGGLGGFFGPIAFGHLLQWTGVWTTSWMALAVLSVICLGWMHVVIHKMTAVRSTDVAQQIEESPGALSARLRVHCPMYRGVAQLEVVVRPEIAHCSLWKGLTTAAVCGCACVNGVRPATAMLEAK